MSEKPVRLPRFLPMSFLCCLLVPTVPAAHANLIGVDFESGNLYQVSTFNASLSLIGNTGVAHLGSLEQGPGGLLYGITAGMVPVLYKIDPSTAVATEVGPLGIGFVFEGSLAFAPDGTAYGTNQGTSANCGLFEVDVSSGAATPIGTLTGGAHDIDGLAWRSDGKLVGLDRETNALLQINPTNADVEAVIVALGPAVGEVGGMVALGDVAYFATGGPTAWPAGSNELYSADLFTGAHALVGSFSPTITGVGVSGLAVPASSTLLLMGFGSLLVVMQRRH